MNLIYDGKCKICKKTVKLFQKLGLKEKINFITSENKAELKRMNIQNKELLKEYVILTNEKKTLKGFYVFRFLIDLIPSFIFFQFLFHLPFINLIGEKTYNFVSKTRKCMS